MKKIPSIFLRNPENMRELTEEINPVCQWVFDGEGRATQKYDGTCCLIKDGKYFKRRMIKESQEIPIDFIEEEHDHNTCKTFGWVPVDPKDKANKYHMKAFREGLGDGTYELVGPNIQGHPETRYRNFPDNALIRHSEAAWYYIPNRNFNTLKKLLKKIDAEGLVFHHPDGRMGKIKKSDFGLKRKEKVG